MTGGKAEQKGEVDRIKKEEREEMRDENWGESKRREEKVERC